MQRNKKELDFYNFGKDSIGQIVLDYVFWILKESEKRNIKRIYFLSRDGFVLQKIASDICKKFNLNIECKYLYCSRYVLQISTLWLNKKEEIEDVFFSKRCLNTPITVLKRFGIKDNDIKSILNNLSVKNPNEVLNEYGLIKFKEKLISNEKFFNLIQNISKKSYNTAIEYFKQEGVFNGEDFVIVDSGWNGNLQSSFKQFFKKQNNNVKIIGFYFGLYKKRIGNNNEEFLTYFFNYKSNLKNKIFFNPSVFECYLMAGHGLTIGYKKQSNSKKIVPILSDFDENLFRIADEQIKGILDYVKNNMQKYKTFLYKNSLRKNYKIIKRLMVNPTIDELKLFEQISFCDDIFESYKIKFVSPSYNSSLKNLLLLREVFSKVFKRKVNKNNSLFWPYGQICYLNPAKKFFYKINLNLRNFLRIVFGRKK